jgi:predicted nucleotidyltransferase
MVIRDNPPVILDDAALMALAARYGIQELALFGSVLRDDFTPASDVDVLVTFAPGSPVRSLLDVIAVQEDLTALLGRPVDLVQPHLLHRFIRDRVLAERRTLYVAPHGCPVS